MSIDEDDDEEEEDDELDAPSIFIPFSISSLTFSFSSAFKVISPSPSTGNANTSVFLFVSLFSPSTAKTEVEAEEEDDADVATIEPFVNSVFTLDSIPAAVATILLPLIPYEEMRNNKKLNKKENECAIESTGREFSKLSFFYLFKFSAIASQYQ